MSWPACARAVSALDAAAWEAPLDFFLRVLRFDVRFVVAPTLPPCPSSRNGGVSSCKTETTLAGARMT